MGTFSCAQLKSLLSAVVLALMFFFLGAAVNPERVNAYQCTQSGGTGKCGCGPCADWMCYKGQSNTPGMCGQSNESEPDQRCMPVGSEYTCDYATWGWMVPGMPDNNTFYAPSTTCSPPSGGSSCNLDVNILTKVGGGRSFGLCATTFNESTGAQVSQEGVQLLSGGGGATPFHWGIATKTYTAACGQRIEVRGVAHHYDEQVPDPGRPCTWGSWGESYTLRATNCDTTPPSSCSLAFSPASPTSFSNNVTVTASTADSGTGVGKVDFYFNQDTGGGTGGSWDLIGSLNGGGAKTWSGSQTWVTSNTSHSVGTHRSAVNVYDVAGNLLAWNSSGCNVNYNLYNDPPNTPTLLAPPNNVWLNYNPTFQATVADPNGGLQTVQAYFSYGGWGGAVSGSGGTSSWDPGAVPDTTGILWRAYAQDSLSATSSWSGYWTLLKDTVAPAVTNSVSPTGWTNANPTWSWTASDATSGIRPTNSFYLDTDWGANTYTNNYSYQPNLGSGIYSVRVRGYDRAGNEGFSGWVAAYVDKTAPTVNLTVDPTSWTSRDPIWNWVPSDSGGSGLKTQGTFSVYLDGTDTGIRYNVDYTMYHPTNLADGAHRVRICAGDNAGNQGCSAEVYGYVDRTGPVVSLSVSPTSWTNLDPTWSWTASDAGSGLRTDHTYLIYLDGVNTGIYKNKNDSLTYTPPSLADGMHTVKVCAYDATGTYGGIPSNEGCSVEVSAYVDRSPPLVNISVNSGANWANYNPTWSWTGTDAVSGIRNSSAYYIYLDGTDTGSRRDKNGNLTYTPNLADGTHTVRVCAYDQAGNSGCSEVIAYVDKTLPVINLSVVPVWWSPTSPVWSWSGSDATSGLLSTGAYAIFLDNLDTGIRKNPGDVLTYAPTLNDGQHDLRVCAYDKAGNVACQDVIGYLDRVAPAVNLAVVPSAWTNTDPTWSWTGTDATSGIRDSNAYSIYLDGTDTGIRKGRNDTLSYNPTGLSEGEHYLQITAYDNAGNVGFSSIVYAYIDRVPPTITLDEDHVASDPSHVSPHWFWVAADSGSGLRTTNTYYVECDFTCSGSSYNFFTNSTEFHPTLQVGSYSIRVTAYDQANNSTATPWKPVTIINVNAPTTPVLIAPPDKVWINYNPTFTATATDPRGHQVKARYDLDLDNYIDGDGSWVVSGANSLWFAVVPDTSGRLWRAKAQNSDGLESAWSTPWTLLKDTVPPTLNLAVSPTGWTNTDPVWTWSGAVDERSGIRLTNTYRNTLDSVDLGFTQATTYTTSTLTDGLHPFQACVYDNAGNLGCSSPVNAFIDKTPPLINLNEDHTTLDPYHASPHWYWTASDKGGSNLRTANTYFVECNWTCSPPLSSFWTTSLEYHPALPNGTFSIRVTAYDAAGNSGISGWKQVTILACTTPDIPTLDPGTGCTNTIPSWSWTAPTGGARIVNYEIQRSWAVDNVQQAATTYTPTLSSGVYWIKVRAQNSCGNWGEFSPSVQMTVDQTPPDAPAGICRL